MCNLSQAENDKSNKTLILLFIVILRGIKYGVAGLRQGAPLKRYNL
jgi:hypothetical protein